MTANVTNRQAKAQMRPIMEAEMGQSSPSQMSKVFPESSGQSPPKSVLVPAPHDSLQDDQEDHS